MREGALGRMVLLWLFVTLGLTSWCGGDELLEAGRELYQLHCARCHGAGGEGVEDYAPEPLQGSHALADLIRIVEETMPEDDPEACTGEAARHVASYIYQTFYVPRATADQPPPRVELARLTVRQYEQSVADLLGTFLGEAVADDRRGLTARYYNARGFRHNKLVQEREDASVMFDFGQTSPDPERIDAEEFAIQWQGSVIAEDTGDYEFLVVTPNGVRMKWLEIEESHHDLSHEPDSNEQAQDKLTRINKWYCEQVAYLVRKLSETPEPNGDGSLLDHTLVVWTNELGKGNSHTLNDIPFILIGNGLGFRMGRSIKYPRVTHNRLLLALAHAFGHHLETFGKPDLCEGGVLPGLV